MGQTQFTEDKIIKAFEDCAKGIPKTTHMDDILCFYNQQIGDFDYYAYSIASISDPENGLIALIGQFLVECNESTQKSNNEDEKIQKINNIKNKRKYSSIKFYTKNLTAKGILLSLATVTAVTAGAVASFGPVGLIALPLTIGLTFLFTRTSETTICNKIIGTISKNLFVSTSDKNTTSLAEVFGDNNVIVFKINCYTGETQINYHSIPVLHDKRLAYYIEKLEKEQGELGKMRSKYYDMCYRAMKLACKEIMNKSRDEKTNKISKEDFDQIKKNLEKKIEDLFSDRFEKEYEERHKNN